ncbi:hypothetical protein [Flavobacterium urocaniciphilum]|uniref:Uncharacterized protein n=1 Tax=Flavobacterium urocaniciphilum TaxID=1299341 RepID=A0A1H9CV84_9FLAO|nr:hypothetical protein [Flavobacterium urocaniciphilum]SEQ05095.1 hypothetical protein SAMN05444005_105101 [Flavobacterium urocaniciphilum]
MKNLIHILLFFPILLIGQSSGNNNSVKEEAVTAKELSKKTVPVNSIAAQFNAKVIAAYSNQSEQFISDFYNYLTLYNQSESADLQQEIDKSILQMYLSENMLVNDFITGSDKKITLLQLLQLCKENKFVVTLSNIQNTALNANNFEMKYQLLVTNKSVTKTYNLVQKVYLFPVLKSFGTTQKTVWELKLGEF